MLSRFDHVRAVASETEQLYVGAVVDRDLRSAEQVAAIKSVGAYVLAVTEVENLFLHPPVVEAIGAEHGLNPEDAWRLLRDIADRLAGRWIFERTSVQGEWSEDLGSVSGVARSFGLLDLEQDAVEGTKQIAAQIPGIGETEIAKRAQQLRHALTEWQAVRQDNSRLWRECFGKEVLQALPRHFGLFDAEAFEKRATRLWRSSGLAPSAEAEAIRDYIGSLPLAGG